MLYDAGIINGVACKKSSVLATVNNVHIWYPVEKNGGLFCIVLSDIVESNDIGVDNGVLYYFNVLRFSSSNLKLNTIKDMLDDPQIPKEQLIIGSRFIRSFLSFCLYWGRIDWKERQKTL